LVCDFFLKIGMRLHTSLMTVNHSYDSNVNKIGGRG
jgi:hypothetical protein